MRAVVVTGYGPPESVVIVERPSPRTHNLYRALLRELMRYAIERAVSASSPV